jgi:predicted nucleic acid-binding protein
MNDLVFVDSNVLLYRWDAVERRKQPAALRWLEALWESRTGRLSDQVLNEFYVVATRKLEPAMPRQTARDEVRAYQTWRVFQAGAEATARAWEVEDRYGLSFWDALIVAAAQLSGCRHLLSEDLQDGQDLGGVQVCNPFARAPSDLGLGRP